MRAFTVAAVMGGLLAQEDAQARKERVAKMQELRKKLDSGSEPDVLTAIAELGDLKGDDAIDYLAPKLYKSSDAVRIAAAHSIARHKTAGSASSLGKALQANWMNETMSKTLIEALAELDMCSSIPYLGMALQINKYAYAEDALGALTKIGCPECAGGLVAVLALSEKEAEKPDEFFDECGGSVENQLKDKHFAGLTGPIGSALNQVTGQSRANARDWTAHPVSTRLGKIYLCDLKNETFYVPYGKNPVCPNADPKRSHKDVFLKHRCE